MVKMISDAPYKNGIRVVGFAYDSENKDDVALINRMLKLCSEQPRCENCIHFYKEGCFGNYMACCCKFYDILESLDNPHHDMDGRKCAYYEAKETE